MNKSIGLICAAALVLIETSPAFAFEVQGEPRLGCESILVAEYVEFKNPNGHITFADPPTAYYQITDYVKGPPYGRLMPIKYDFAEEGAASPKGWRFEQSLLPEPGSKWILFIPFIAPLGADRHFETYRGSLGRVPYAPEIVTNIREILERDRYQSSSIVVAKYLGHDIANDAVEAEYKILTELKGDYFAPKGSGASRITHSRDAVAIKYSDLLPKGQVIESASMPAIGSKWILFIRSAYPEPARLETIGDAEGRISYSRHELDHTMDIIEHSASYWPANHTKTRAEVQKEIDDD